MEEKKKLRQKQSVWIPLLFLAAVILSFLIGLLLGRSQNAEPEETAGSLPADAFETIYPDAAAEPLKSTASLITPSAEIPATSAEYDALWDEMVDAGFVQRILLGTVSSEELPIYLYIIQKNDGYLLPDYTPTAMDSNEGNHDVLWQKPRICLTSGIHGNERSTPMVLWDFVHRMWTDPEMAYLTGGYDWIIIPMVNPWGFSHSYVSSNDGTTTISGSNTASKAAEKGYYPEFNKSDVQSGIRRNEDGVDINRDSMKLASEEARLVTEAILDNRPRDPDHPDQPSHYAFYMDLHQANPGSRLNEDGTPQTDIAVFLSMQFGASEAQKTYIFSRWMRAGAATQAAANAAYGLPADTQTIYPWDGTEKQTFRNFCADYADYSMCMEGSVATSVYSGTTQPWNEIANTVTNTQFYNFMLEMTATGPENP